jgi:hypothetical protein
MKVNIETASASVAVPSSVSKDPVRFFSLAVVVDAAKDRDPGEHAVREKPVQGHGPRRPSRRYALTALKPIPFTDHGSTVLSVWVGANENRWFHAGVSSMGVTGDGRDRLEVVGDSVDTVCLVKCLRKKVGHATILQVEEVKEKKAEEKKPEEAKIEYLQAPYCYPGYYYHHQSLQQPSWWQWR